MRCAKIMTVFFVAVLGLLATSGTSRAAEGPISYWSFDEASGTMAYDSVGDNHGTIYGAQWTTGIVNSALSFDGHDDYVRSVYPGPLGGSPRTVCAWAKTSSTAAQVILSYGELGMVNGLTFRMGLSLFPGPPGVSVDTHNGNATYCATVADGEWHHYAAVVPVMPSVTIGDVQLYQDGELLDTLCASYCLYRILNTDGTLPIHIGRLHRPLWGVYYHHFDGAIDEVALYDRALTDAEVHEVYEQGLGPKAVAIANIRDAITEKVEAIERIDAAIAKEWAAYIALEELLDSGDYGDLNYGDIVTAKQKTHSAIQHQEQARNALEKSIEKLQDALAALGQ